MRNLLLLLCLGLLIIAPAESPGESASLLESRLLSSVSGTRVRVFDSQADAVIPLFHRFMAGDRMSNDRPLPPQLVEDTIASLSAYLAGRERDEPSYFVASYVDKVLPFGDAKKKIYLQRYGGTIAPQKVCPVFASSGVPELAVLLANATNLPADVFQRAPGDAGRMRQLFLLTEASHCGFLARALVHQDILASIRDSYTLRALLESMGDFEATQVLRDAYPAEAKPDETDVLWAARVVSLFLSERAGPYSSIPVMARIYESQGLIEGSRRVEEARHAVQSSRELFWSLFPATERGPVSLLQLREMGATVESANAYGARFHRSASLEYQLLIDFVSALDILNVSTRGKYPSPIAVAAPRIGKQVARLTLPGSL